MEKITLQNQKISPNFIGSWIMEPLSICDDLISYFEANKNKQIRGVTAAGEKMDIKDSIDIKITPKEVKLPGNEIFEIYFQNLFILYKDYVNDWPFLKTFAENLHIDSFNLQRYQQGQHFQNTHTERSGLETLHRIFAWMTYLNDVDLQDGGSTFFSHYDLEVQPKKGLTLIWPSEWTHAHRGNLLNANSKYIITGWMHFPK
tara:strand:- start:1118 stop:1723 length:606 start_codon:yes stop_codon:yes gene_type:complete